MVNKNNTINITSSALGACGIGAIAAGVEMNNASHKAINVTLQPGDSVSIRGKELTAFAVGQSNNDIQVGMSSNLPHTATGETPSISVTLGHPAEINSMKAELVSWTPWAVHTQTGEPAPSYMLNMDISNTTPLAPLPLIVTIGAVAIVAGITTAAVHYRNDIKDLVRRTVHIVHNVSYFLRTGYTGGDHMISG